ncbi:MAG: iron-sulfur cluster assembly scaffold protein [Sphingomicrobium sp.]
MNAPTYTIDILRLAASLEGPTPLKRVDGLAELRSPTCGSTIHTEVMVDGDGRLEVLSQDVTACAFGQAAAALVARGAIGATYDSVEGALAELGAWLTGERGDPGSWPGLDALAPARSKRGRHGAIILPFRALAAALAERRDG